jgi:hypothetical protein
MMILLVHDVYYSHRFTQIDSVSYRQVETPMGCKLNQIVTFLALMFCIAQLEESESVKVQSNL